MIGSWLLFSLVSSGSPQQSCFTQLGTVGPSRDAIADVGIDGPEATHTTEHFRIVYAAQANSADAPLSYEDITLWRLPDGTTRQLSNGSVPNYIEALGHSFEYARTKYLELGFREVPDDLIVRVFDLGPDSLKGISFAPFGIGITNTIDWWELGAVAAHELFHQVQYTYGPAGLGLNYFVKPDNPTFYDTFALEGVANVGTDLLYPRPQDGGEQGENANDYTSNTDIDFWDQSYDGALFWHYAFEQSTQRGGEVLSNVAYADSVRRFLYERGRTTSTQAALELTLQHQNAPNLATLLDHFFVAIGVHEFFDIDPTLPSDNRAYDFLGAQVDHFNPVMTFGSLNTGSLTQQQSRIMFDGGARYYRIDPGAPQSFVLRLIGATTQVRAHVIQVENKTDGTLSVRTTSINSRETGREVTLQNPNTIINTLVVVRSLSGEQPFHLELNPTGSGPRLEPAGCSLNDTPLAFLAIGLIAGGRLRRASKRRLSVC